MGKTIKNYSGNALSKTRISDEEKRKTVFSSHGIKHLKIQNMI